MVIPGSKEQGSEGVPDQATSEQALPYRIGAFHAGDLAGLSSFA